MRVLICCIILALALVWGSALLATDNAETNRPGGVPANGTTPTPSSEPAQPPAPPATPTTDATTTNTQLPQPTPADQTTGGTATSPPLDVTEPPPSEQAFPPPQIPAPPGVIPSPVAPSETPSGYPTPPPLPPVPEIANNYVYFWADSLRTTYENDAPALTIAQGNVTARYKNIQATAQRGMADYRTNMAVFEGNVIFRIGIEEVRGERLSLNMVTGKWSFVAASTTITPQFTQGYLRAPVFATARDIEGQKTQQITAYDMQATTCNLSDPHYDIIARSMVVYPNDKIVMRKVTFYALHHKIVTIPRFVIPIQQIRRNPNLIPQIGQSAEEGYYLKTAYSYLGTKSQMGFLLLDLMTRKGIGTGIRQTYHYPGISGDVNLYRLHDENINQDTYTGTIKHSEKFGTINTSFTSDFRQNSYLYAPQSSSWISRLVLTRNRPGAVSSLVVSDTINNVIARTVNLAGTLQHNQALSNTMSVNTSFDYTGYSTLGQTQARLNSDVELLKKEQKFDWTISAYKISDLSDEAFTGTGTFAGIEKLPELGLISDTTRLGHILPFGIPARMKLSYGNYTELPQNTQADRLYFDIETPALHHNLSDLWNATYGAAFRQYAYSDNTAQYSYDANVDLKRKLGEKSNLDFTYRRQAPDGFTPFRFDYVGKYNVVNSSLNLQESEKFKLSLLTGYDFQQQTAPWQDITLRCSIQPSRSFLFYTATGYDLNTNKWRTLINQIRIRTGKDFRLDFGTRYDTSLNKLATARTQLDTPIGKKWRLQAIAGFNGLTNSFDYRSLRITRDLHCWEASLMYVNQGGFYLNQGIWFNMRIKAFPLFENYGMGAFGQGLDTSVGQVY